MTAISADIALIDNFVVNRLIAETAWGFVFEVSPVNLKRKYALKISKPGDPETRLIREREILSDLGNHPHVTQIYFAGEFNGQPYIVEDLADFSLRGYLENPARNRDTFQDKLELFSQLMDAVSFAHSSGVVHRDLKPDNILITQGMLKPTLSICDFGLAEFENVEGLESSLEDATSAAGTVQYLSPEQREGGTVDHRSDIFAMGLIFYQMLTYKKPSVGLAKVSEVNPNLPSWVDEFIHQCLRTNPEDRFQTVTAMQLALEKATAPEVKIAPPIPESAPLSEVLRDKLSSGLKHIAYSPLYVIFFPFVLFGKLDPKYGNEGPVFLLCIAVGFFYYFGAFPFLTETNLHRLLVKDPPSGTIVYYDFRDEGRRGFRFVDATALPEKESFFLPTPEIQVSDFEPQFSLNPEGTELFYTTPDGLVRADLVKIGKGDKAQTTIIRSEVFNYFNHIGFRDGKLYARLKNETWQISSNGELQPTKVMLTPPERITAQGDFRINRSFFGDIQVEHDSFLPGSLTLGRGLGNAYVWIPGKQLPIFSQQ